MVTGRVSTTMCDENAPRLPDFSPYILIVDDEPVVRKFLAHCLETWGYAFEMAGNAAEAISSMIAKPAMVVLCDVKLPDHDGLWLAARLRAEWPDTQVVMASGIDDVETIRKSHDLGAVDYVTKPIVPTQLRDVLRRVIPGKDAWRTPEDRELVPSETLLSPGPKFEAEYTLESPVKCPACGERITALKAVRLVRTHVNFTSTLPRRGRVVVCPNCLSVMSAELTNF